MTRYHIPRYNVNVHLNSLTCGLVICSLEALLRDAKNCHTLLFGKWPTVTATHAIFDKDSVECLLTGFI